MPKETFFNLPAKKRETIEKAAIEEFSKNGYDNASINRIVEACKIAKGSFYQYFEDKKDIYKHLLDLIAQKKMEFVSPTLMNPEGQNIFDLIRELWVSGLKFANSSPELVKIGNDMLKNISRPVYQEFIGDKLYMSNDIFEEMLKNAIQKGEVRSDIDVKYISAMFTSMNFGSVEYYLINQEEVKNNRALFNEKMLETVDLFIDFIKNGIASKQ